MYWFLILSALAICLALAIVLPAFLRRTSGAESASMQTYQDNIAAARERQHTLKNAIVAGELDEQQAEEYAQEIESTLLRDTENTPADSPSKPAKRDWLGAAIVITVLLAVVPSLYLVVGTPQAMLLTAGESSLALTEDAPDMETLITRLQKRLDENPEEVEALYWLGRIYAAGQDYKTANDYYERANRLAPNSPDIIAAYVDMLMITDSDSDLVSGLLDDGLNAAPSHPTLLWLAGSHAENNGDLTQALRFWRQAHANFADSPEMQQEIALVIRDAEALQGSTSPTANLSSPASNGVVAIVQIDETMTLPDKALLFVFAKAAGDNAPPMPLAVYRRPAGTFPLTVHLNDDMAMLPAIKMSQFQRYNINARLSKSGNAKAASGDFYGVVDDVAPQSTVTVIINKIAE